MPNYSAPLDDMLFLFDKLRDNKNYNELDKYNEVSSDLVKDILEEAAKINQNLILPLAVAGDENPAKLENGVVITPPGIKRLTINILKMDGYRCLVIPNTEVKECPKQLVRFLTRCYLHLHFLLNFIAN